MLLECFHEGWLGVKYNPTFITVVILLPPPYFCSKIHFSLKSPSLALQVLPIKTSTCFPPSADTPLLTHLLSTLDKRNCSIFHKLPTPGFAQAAP